MVEPPSVNLEIRIILGTQLMMKKLILNAKETNLQLQPAKPSQPDKLSFFCLELTEEEELSSSKPSNLETFWLLDLIPSMEFHLKE